MSMPKMEWPGVAVVLGLVAAGIALLVLRPDLGLPDLAGFALTVLAAVLRRKRPDEEAPTGGTSAIALVLALVVGSTAVGCARDAQGVRVDQYDQGLAVAGMTIDTGYGAAVVACDVAEGRAGDDPAAVDRVRERCDRAFASFEVMRVAHDTAASHLESVGDGTDPKYMELATRVFSAAAEVWGIVSELRRDLGAP